jgi:hypothetical protein
MLMGNIKHPRRLVVESLSIPITITYALGTLKGLLEEFSVGVVQVTSQ